MNLFSYNLYGVDTFTLRRLLTLMYYVYIMTNYSQKPFYIGVTNNIERRVWEHRQESKEHYCAQYNIRTLVYIETCPDIQDALQREKQLKGWTRLKKIHLIKILNPDWVDLCPE